MAAGDGGVVDRLMNRGATGANECTGVVGSGMFNLGTCGAFSVSVDEVKEISEACDHRVSVVRVVMLLDRLVVPPYPGKSLSVPPSSFGTYGSITVAMDGIPFSGSCCIGKTGEGSMFFAFLAFLIFLERFIRNTIKATMSKNTKMQTEAMAAITPFERPLFDDVLDAPEALHIHISIGWSQK